MTSGGRCHQFAVKQHPLGAYRLEAWVDGMNLGNARNNFSLPAKPLPAPAGEITPSTLAAFNPATKNRSETAMVGLTIASIPEVGAV